jgi:hypothetical protein
MYKPDEEEIVQAAEETAPEAEAVEADMPIEAPAEEAEEAPAEEKEE